MLMNIVKILVIQVNPISDDNILELLLQHNTANEDEEEGGFNTLGLEELAIECRADAVKIRLSEEVLDLLVRLRSYLRDELVPPIYCSDRRLKKAVKALTTAAAAQGIRFNMRSFVTTDIVTFFFLL